MYGTKLKKFDRGVLHTVNEDGDRSNNDAMALLFDNGDDPKDGSNGTESSQDSDEEIVPLSQRAVQLLAIRANFPVCTINGYDGRQGHRIYFLRKGQVQEVYTSYLIFVIN